MNIHLTDREFVVLSGARDGLTYKEIAHKCGIKEGTIKNFMQSAFRKLDAKDKTHAVVKAIQLGLINLWED